jgi:RND family efflux transporter MFP subunit
MKKAKTFLFAPFFSIALLLASCSNNQEPATKQVETAKKPIVRIQQVTAIDVDQTREFTATVMPNISNNIAPNMPVRIDKIHVEVGDQVRKGQQLVSMESTNLENAKTQLSNVRTEFERVDELYKIGGVSQSNWDAMKMNLEMAEKSYNNLLDNTRLLSPIDGIVTVRNYDNGDMYGGLPVLTIQQIAPVKLLIYVSEYYFTKVKKGMDVQIKLDVYGDEIFEGKVSLIHPTIDPTTRTFQVEITIDNKDMRVRPGMFARVELSFGSLKHVVVPDRAVIRMAGAGDRYIYVLNNDNTVTMKKVALGRLIDGNYEILSGLNNGDKVVTAGQARLMNGVEVEVEK